MARFYDPKDDSDLKRMETLLRNGSIGYVLRTEKSGEKEFIEIHVAEEDIPQAEEIIMH